MKSKKNVRGSLVGEGPLPVLISWRVRYGKHMRHLSRHKCVMRAQRQKNWSSDKFRKNFWKLEIVLDKVAKMELPKCTFDGKFNCVQHI